MSISKGFKYTVYTIVSVFIGLYLGIIIILNIPFVQDKITSLVTEELKRVLHSDVAIGKIDMGLLNRIIIEDVTLADQQQNELLNVSRLSVKFDIWPLFKKRIRISSIQLFGLNANVHRLSPTEPTNYQFIIDAFSSNDTIDNPFDLDIRINSILIRRGYMAYHVLSEPETPNIFNPNHINIENFAATIALKALQKDSLNAVIRRISFEEHSGFLLKKFSSKVIANHQKMTISNFNIDLSNSSLKMDTLSIKYDSVPTLSALTKDVIFHGKATARIVPSDMAPFIPILERLNKPFDMNFIWEGIGYDLNIPKIQITDNQSVFIEGDADIKDWNKNLYLYGKISRAEINHTGMENISANIYEYSPLLQRLQNVRLNGEISGYLHNLKFNGTLNTGAGKLNGELTMNVNKENIRSYSGNLSSNNLNLGLLLGDEKKYGIADFLFELKGLNYHNKYPETSIKGLISSIEYNQYKYENIQLDGMLKDGGFNGQMMLDDENGHIELNGALNLIQATPIYNIKTMVRNLRPHDLLLTDGYEGKELSFDLTADFTGHSIDDLNGTISLDNLTLSSIDKEDYHLNNLTITSGKVNEHEKELNIHSSFIEATVLGNYSYKTLPASILQTIQRYIPSLLTLKTGMPTPHNNFKFSVNMNEASFFENIFQIPIELHYPATLAGSVNDNEEIIRIEGHFPEFRYNNTLYDSGDLLCESQADIFACNIRTGMLMKSGGMLNIAIDAKAKDDNIETTINWGNNTNVTYVGKLAAITHFYKTEGRKPILQANIDIEPTKIVLNDTVWNMHPAQVQIDSGRVFVNNFLFEHENQHLRINGKLTKNKQDSCVVELKDIDLDYLLRMANFDAVEFGGLATGKVNLKGVLEEMNMNADLNVHHFTVNKALIGKAVIHAEWDKDIEGVRLLADIEEKDVSKTHVTGLISPKKEGLDIRVYADNTNIGLLYPFIDGIFSQMEGRAKGYIRIFGPLPRIDIEGDVIANATGFLPILNTSFNVVNDSIHLRSGNIFFNNVHITDAEGHHGNVNGYVHHHMLKNITYHFDINGTNLLMYNTQDTGDLNFYGKIYGTGNVTLDGGNNALNVTANVRAAPNTEFTYITGITTEAISNQFITFVDKTPRRIQDSIQTYFYHPSDANKVEKEDGPPMDIRMNMLIDATEDATMRIIMDPVAGDFISANGNGNLQVNYYNKGDFRIFGNYVISQGIYKLSMQEVIRKDFTLNQGGTVTFSGDPGRANVDVQATYTVNSASLSDLGIGNLNQTQSTIRVNCLMNLTGNLSDPEIHFDLELPTVNEEDRELVRSITATEEQMNTQIIYLLGIGKFYTYDYTTNSTQSNATSSLAMTTLSSQLNNMLSQWMENKNWNIGANLSTGQEGWSDVEAEAVLSGRLMNNRLLINGNFGYRDKALANTNFVGDFEAIWLLTKNGEWRLRGYNQTNDRYFIKSTLTTQGIGLIYKKDFDNWLDMFRLFWKKKKKEEQQIDSIPAIQQKREAWLQIREKKNE